MPGPVSLTSMRRTGGVSDDAKIRMRAARRRVLDGVVDQVDQRLPQHEPIAEPRGAPAASTVSVCRFSSASTPR